jgi:hypothetical protein
LVGAYFGYKIFRHYAAPASIYAIRDEPIYNYESDTLKIISRSEDYGGTDWKGVYSEPHATVRFIAKTKNMDTDLCMQELDGVVARDWSFKDRYSLLGEDVERAMRYIKITTEDSPSSLSLEPGTTGVTLCIARIK